jgi:hypothetical protein
LKEDKIAEKKRLAPYYIGGFEHGANTSNTEGVHYRELKQYLEAPTNDLTNGTTNGSAHKVPPQPVNGNTNGAPNEATNQVTNGVTPIPHKDSTHDAVNGEVKEMVLQ